MLLYNKMKLLELFSGTQSVGKVAKELGYSVVSVDINDYHGRFIPTHKTDIMDFNYQQYEHDEFDVIWASPPCLFYSTLQYCWYGREKKGPDGMYTYSRELHNQDMITADGWVNKALEMINYFEPSKWIIENPKTGLLKTRDFMKDLPFVDVDYCRYTDWGYRKQTRLWTNVPIIGKTCNKNCGNMKAVGKGHKIDMAKTVITTDRYRVPPLLIREILEY
jgi:site-specific DNA-cytosine methylase